MSTLRQLITAYRVESIDGESALNYNIRIIEALEGNSNISIETLNNLISDKYKDIFSTPKSNILKGSFKIKDEIYYLSTDFGKLSLAQYSDIQTILTVVEFNNESINTNIEKLPYLLAIYLFDVDTYAKDGVGRLGELADKYKEMNAMEALAVLNFFTESDRRFLIDSIAYSRVQQLKIQQHHLMTSQLNHLIRNGISTLLDLQLVKSLVLRR